MIVKNKQTRISLKSGESHCCPPVDTVRNDRKFHEIKKRVQTFSQRNLKFINILSTIHEIIQDNI